MITAPTAVLIQAAAFLLNRRYRPFYKWAHRALSDLPVLGAALAPKLRELAAGAAGEISSDLYAKVDLIEAISAGVIAELKAEGLSDADSDFLLPHAEAVQSTIKDPQLASLHLMAE